VWEARQAAPDARQAAGRPDAAEGAVSPDSGADPNGGPQPDDRRAGPGEGRGGATAPPSGRDEAGSRQPSTAGPAAAVPFVLEAYRVTAAHESGVGSRAEATVKVRVGGRVIH